ncbi:MAG TPA: hypothetical protein VD947_00860, partial [Patescibacteria group bacterium]|nr:hypothetical protein [Patescibacteria group bacterium]
MADEEKSDNRQGQLFNPDIRADESSPRDSTKGKVGADEANLANKLGKGYTPFEKTLGRGMAGELIKPGALLHKPIKLLLRNKKKSIGGAILGLIIGLLMLMANVFHGPLQFIHFSQLLQQFHMQPNEDFGSDRAFRTLIYGSVGQAERGRLGLTTNILADRWERRLADNGFRPLYSNNTGRFVGFELINDTGLFKAAAGDKASTVFQELADNDVQIRTYGELDADGVPAHRSKDGVPDKSAMVLDLSDRDKCNFSCMRKVIRAVGKQTGSFKAYSAVSSRLLIKRAGVNFHPINKIRGKLDEAAKKRVLKKRADDIKNGVEPASTSVDRDGQETESDKDSDDTDVKASEEANAAISEVESAEDAEALKSVKGRLIAGGIAGGATAMVGVF